MRKGKMEKGITLIALILTIVILLILAIVAINSITNDDLLGKAENVTGAYNNSVINEQGTISGYEGFLGNYIGGGTQLTEEEIYKQHVLGEATNIENYGKKVNFKSKGAGLDTLVWRLFYQDDRNAYLISETADEDYPVRSLYFYTCSDSTYIKTDIVEKYNSGADVSAYGRALMPKASSLFTSDNTNENIIATAYLCDPEVWDEYTDAAGKASYAMGSPTIELFAISYNASGLGNTINLTIGEYGYENDAGLGWFVSSDKYAGIYNLRRKRCMEG